MCKDGQSQTFLRRLREVLMSFPTRYLVHLSPTRCSSPCAACWPPSVQIESPGRVLTSDKTGAAQAGAGSCCEQQSRYGASCERYTLHALLRCCRSVPSSKLGPCSLGRPLRQAQDLYLRALRRDPQLVDAMSGAWCPSLASPLLRITLILPSPGPTLAQRVVTVKDTR